ncbi:tRNA-specific 2-thiouridylase MnmA [Gemmata obscuriglobus]|uniref:ATP-dependent sacrificial sulfur transferase LarE n=1 Tax=Gemmata obscuriglobus TaxID=114 RepID=A0A2Z3H7A0_9BACT|nr:ATP-dependent sacrificial sulfur transferase LarE [Gemmata obscuriglobus]AWM37544.1 ATP-dependent sacrificial sulfur transferase LarE [Gemmata obscuriglobus]QEG29672.1 tRNA-specific 2-thiouridylase MnmA [Gemmata obscuriglobus]VTS08989.1 asparagine synthase : TIGR00268 family protein OS=Singulisphaera acidiphila (strain ATCC BAA-1392 / DSM 18658 / VKM B-2454 / MOB10) GN=Sinac_0253 PE=4 SV=1: Asn_synthase [Gemmata obscuriglobus UQM 2246]
MFTEANAIELSATLDAKREALLATLGGMPGVAVAFSGGIDSTVVAKAAHLALGTRAVAVTADSPSVARNELRDARELAKLIGIRHVVVRTDEFRNPDYTKNDGSRCYHCKTELYTTVESILPELEVSIIASGANLDDRGDYRPGLLAAAEHSVRHPLQDAGFTKADVRALARFWGLPTWDKPAAPCLSSRMAPGVTVTPERTKRVEDAEAVLRSLGLRECRVRYHEGDLARVEVPVSELSKFAADPVRGELARALHGLGFKFVTLDLDGFRSGNLNELVPIELKLRYRRDEPTQAPAADEL